MKKLILILVFIVTYNIQAQTQYIGVFADIRNSLVGSDATIKTPALDIVILGGVTDKHGITVEVGYENFSKIDFSKMYFGVGYTFTNYNDKLSCTVTAEPTYITRKWGGEHGTITYASIGGSGRISYKVNDCLNVSLLNNILKRTDNAHRYDIKSPLIYSTYLGLTYTFKREY